ncbi:MAG: enoyl-CoA hydratase-related protein [Burkholderiaceae bacterium]
MTDETLSIARDGAIVTITMNRVARRNPLSLSHIDELIDAFEQVEHGDAHGIILAANGPAFCSGHDFSDMIGADLPAMRRLLRRCTQLMETIQRVPQVVIARVQGPAIAAGTQLVATCDLAVAAETATFATPGGQKGWFCHTPVVAVSRCLSRKHALEMALSGDRIDARTAVEWGLINRAVPADQLDAQTRALAERVTRGSRMSKGLGKQGFYAHIDMDLPKAYAYAIEMMASASQTQDAQESMRSFVEKRTPVFRNR